MVKKIQNELLISYYSLAVDFDLCLLILGILDFFSSYGLTDRTVWEGDIILLFLL